MSSSVREAKAAISRSARFSVVAASFATTLAACAGAVRPELEPLVTDRPDFTESTETVAPGMAQLESGGTYARAAAEHGGSVGEVLLRVGLDKHTELRIGLNSYDFVRSPAGSTRGLEDASLGAKLKLAAGGGVGSWKPAVAVILASSLPTGASAFRASKPQPEAKLGAAWDLSDRVSFAGNLNYTWVREPHDSYGEVAASSSLGVGVTAKTGAYLEYSGFSPREAALSASQYVNGGLTYGFTANLQVDARAGVGMNHIGGPDYFAGIGFARRW